MFLYDVSPHLCMNKIPVMQIVQTVTGQDTLPVDQLSNAMSD